MHSDMIQNEAYDNYNDFQHANIIFSQNFISLFWGLLANNLGFWFLMQKNWIELSKSHTFFSSNYLFWNNAQSNIYLLHKIVEEDIFNHFWVQNEFGFSSCKSHMNLNSTSSAQNHMYIKDHMAIYLGSWT
jgi:hypothetical protein